MADMSAKVAAHWLRSAAEAIERGEWFDGYRIIANEAEFRALEDIVRPERAAFKARIVAGLREAADAMDGERGGGL